MRESILTRLVYSRISVKNWEIVWMYLAPFIPLWSVPYLLFKFTLWLFKDAKK